jgi:hypothetical protein
VSGMSLTRGSLDRWRDGAYHRQHLTAMKFGLHIAGWQHPAMRSLT